MAQLNLAIFRKHRDNIEASNTFEEFKKAQLDFLDLLILEDRIAGDVAHELVQRFENELEPFQDKFLGLESSLSDDIE